MRKWLLILILSTTAVLGQDVKIGNEENQIKVYEYAVKNPPKIKSSKSEDLIYVSIDFNKKHFVEKVTYYLCTLKTMQDENKKVISVSPELDQYIKKTFSFFSNTVFFSKNTGDSNYLFCIPLSKENLQTAIVEVREIMEKQKTENDNKGILPFSDFDLELENLYFNRTKFESKNFKGKLITLNSELIEIAPDLYFIFRILKTNDFGTNTATDYIEYKLMYLNGTDSELITSNREKMYSKRFGISEVLSGGANDTLEDSTYCESDEETERNSGKSDDFKISLNMVFKE